MAKANATRINTIKLLYPKFPLKCVSCDATHAGNIDKAIDDGWHAVVFDTKSDGLVQFAGCPLHFDDFDGKALAYMRGKSSVNRRK